MGLAAISSTPYTTGHTYTDATTFNDGTTNWGDTKTAAMDSGYDITVWTLTAD